MKISEEIDEHIAFLSDPAHEWRRGYPYHTGQACAVARCDPRSIWVDLSGAAVEQIAQLVPAEFNRPMRRTGAAGAMGAYTVVTVWNDGAPDVRHVIWLLEEAADWAREEGR